MNLQNLKDNCVARINEAYQQAEAHYGLKFPRPTIEFSNKLTSTAGKAYFQRNMIKLSVPLLILNEAKFILDTPGHEAAHLISYQRFGRPGIGHGAKWKQVMNIIGQQAKRCHNFTVPKKTNTVTARCSCTTHEISTIRANKIKSGSAYYSCKKCNTQLELGTVRVFRKEPTALLATPNNRRPTKAEIVRYLIAEYKQCKMTLEYALSDKQALTFVMRKTNMSKSLATTYLKNNWDKVA